MAHATVYIVPITMSKVANLGCPSVRGILTLVPLQVMQRIDEGGVRSLSSLISWNEGI